MRWQLRFSLNDLSSHKLWLEENSPSRIAEKRKRQTRQKPFSLLHLTRARSHLPESDNANVCYVVSMGRRLEKNYLFCDPCFLSLFRPKLKTKRPMSDIHIGNILLIYPTKCMLSRTKIHAQNKSDKIIFFQTAPHMFHNNSFLNLFVELGPSRNSPSYNWREE